MWKKLWFAFIFLLIDLGSKFVAWMFLSPNKVVDISNELSLEFIINKTGFGTAAHNLVLKNSMILILLSCSITAYSVGVLLISHYIKKKWVRVTMYSTLLFLCGILNLIIEKIAFPFSPDPILVGTFSKLGPIFLAATIIYLAKDKVYLVLWSLVLGAGVGNVLSMFLPPFGIIDFIFSRFMNRLIGLGVFNLADLMIDLFYVGISIYSALLVSFAIIRRMRKKRSEVDSEGSVSK